MQIISLDKIDSTNIYARNMIRNRDVSGPFLVTAKVQTKGRGRLDRTFDSQTGGLYMSFCVPFADMVSFPVTSLPILASLAVSDAINRELEKGGSILKTKIKWPNDIFLCGKKIAGILTEGITFKQTFWTVFGIGVNISNSLPEELAQAGTLCGLANISPDPQKLSADIAEELLKVIDLAPCDCERMIKLIENRCLTINNRVKCESTGNEGTACGIRPDGSLILKKDDGTDEYVNYGDVTVLTLAL